MELVDLLEDVVGGHGAAGFEPVGPPGGVSIAEDGQLAGGAGPVEGVGAQRLQQPVAGLAAGAFVGDDEALVDEPADEVEHLDRVDVAGARPRRPRRPRGGTVRRTRRDAGT